MKALVRRTLWVASRHRGQLGHADMRMTCCWLVSLAARPVLRCPVTTRLCHGGMPPAPPPSSPPPPPPPPASDLIALQALTVPLLKERLRASGLPVSGRKAELIERLLTAADRGPEPPRPLQRPRAPSGPGVGAIPADPTPRRGAPEGAQTLRVASWNVAGLRGLLKRDEGVASLRRLLAEEKTDVIMLQEPHCAAAVTLPSH